MKTLYRYLPLVLLVPKNSRLNSAEELWKQDKIEETLISLPPYEAIPKHFQQGLSRLDIDWFPRIEVTSLALIETYVENGYGIGLSVAVPRPRRSPKIRALPLEGFLPVTLAALWPAAFAFAAFIADRTNFDAEFLKSVWISAIPALVGAAAASCFVTPQWAQRVWTGWLLIVPIGGLVVLGYSLKQYFLR